MESNKNECIAIDIRPGAFSTSEEADAFLSALQNMLAPFGAQAAISYYGEDEPRPKLDVISARELMEMRFTCPLTGKECKKCSGENCAWDIGGECAVVSIAGSLNALPLDEVAEAMNRVAAEVKRKVYQ